MMSTGNSSDAVANHVRDGLNKDGFSMIKAGALI
jgi:hypothetical protein